MLAILENRTYRHLFLAQVIALVGTGLATVALGLLAFELAGAEADMIAHMNSDHSDAVALYANILCGRPGVGWRITGIDPEGADLARPGDHCRIRFDKPATSAETGRVELVRKVKQARAQVSRG